MDLKKLEVKSDSRGSLVEAFKLPNDGQLFYVVCKPNEIRGNHYHLRKTEKFLVIYGEAEISVKDRDTGDVMKVKTNGNNPMVVTVVPNHTHCMTATEEGAIILAYVDELFDEDNPDTYPEEI